MKTEGSIASILSSYIQYLLHGGLVALLASTKNSRRVTPYNLDELAVADRWLLLHGNKEAPGGHCPPRTGKI